MLRRRPIARAAIGTAVVAGTATSVSGRVARRQEARYGAEDAPQAPPAQVAAAPPDPVQQLKELAGLKDQGVITEEEFAAQKAKILA